MTGGFSIPAGGDEMSYFITSSSGSRWEQTDNVFVVRITLM